MVAPRARAHGGGRGGASGLCRASAHRRAPRARPRALPRPDRCVRARPGEDALRDLGRGARLLPPERESRGQARARHARRALRRRAARRERRDLHGAPAHEPLAGHPPRLGRAEAHLCARRHARDRRLRVAARSHDRAGLLVRCGLLRRLAAARASAGRQDLGPLGSGRAARSEPLAGVAAVDLAVRRRRTHGAP